MCSSQPRLTPRRSFSSGQIQFWTTPAISSPSQATTHRSVSSSGRSNVCGVRALGHLAMAPVVAERLVLGLDDPPRDRPRRPAGARARRAAARRGWRRDRGRRIRKKWRTGCEARPRQQRRVPGRRSSANAASSTRSPGSSRAARARARSMFQASSHVPMPRRRQVRVDVAPDLVLGGVVADRPARTPAAADEPAVDLDEDDVVDRIARRRAFSISTSRFAGGRQVRDPVGQVRGAVQFGQSARSRSGRAERRAR